MDCRSIEFSAEKSAERMERAERVFSAVLLKRIIAFVLYLLGAKRRSIASVVGMPQESIKTAVRVILRDGFAAFRDRRHANTPAVAQTVMAPVRICARREDEWYIVALGSDVNEVKIPVAHKIKARTILLSLLNSKLLSVQETALLLGVSCGHCRQLAENLRRGDVAETLIDQRRGQVQDYKVGPEEKAEIIQQFAARAVTGHSTSSEELARLVNERTDAGVSPRTIRWHGNKLGLAGIKKTLPELVSTLKKTHDDVA
ncbi:MAG: hypothetical protein WCA08_22685 [Desulfoferrobacter sp.]